MRVIDLFKVTTPSRMSDLPSTGLRVQMVDVKRQYHPCAYLFLLVEPASPRHGDVSGFEVSSPGVAAFIGFAAQAKPALTALERPPFTPFI